METHKRALIFGVVLCLLAGVAGGFTARGATYYKWRDKEGVLHLSDTPPINGPYTAIRENDTGEGRRSSVSSLPPARNPRRSPEVMKIPLRKWGNHFLLRACLNHQAEGTFILDTGASLTLIGTRIAREAGITLNESLPILPVKTASGLMFSSVVEVSNFSVGHVTLGGKREVIVHDLHQGEEIDGLIGMDILSDYQVTLQTKRGILILKPLRAIGPVYGGHSRRWWTGRFTFYKHAIHTLKNLRNAPPRVLETFHLTRNHIEDSITLFRNRLISLKLRAEDNLVPLDWRK